MFYVMRVTLHESFYGLVVKQLDILLLIKHIMKDFLFYKQLSQTKMQNNWLKWAFLDFLVKKTVNLFIVLELARYLSSTCRNTDNYKLNDNIAAEIKKNKDKAMTRQFSNNSYKLYDIYN